MKTYALPNNATRLRRNGGSKVSPFVKYKYLYLLLVPPMAFFVVYKYLPMFGIIIAFKEFYVGTGIWGSEWVGLKQFERLFTSYYFPVIFRNTLTISLQHLVFGFPAPIILALLLNEIRRKAFKRVVQTISYLPHFISWVIMAGLMQTLLSPTDGIVAAIFQAMGKNPIYFLGTPDYFRPVLILSGIWKEVGWGTIIYLAALSGVDPELYEAAIIDGANRLQQTIYVTIPSIMSVVVVLLILQVGNILDAGFFQVLNLYSPAVYEVSDIFDTYVYREGLLKANYSFATAVGLFKGIVGLILVAGANRFAKVVGQEGIW